MGFICTLVHQYTHAVTGLQKQPSGSPINASRHWTNESEICQSRFDDITLYIHCVQLINIQDTMFYQLHCCDEVNFIINVIAVHHLCV